MIKTFFTHKPNSYWKKDVLHMFFAYALGEVVEAN